MKEPTPCPKSAFKDDRHAWKRVAWQYSNFFNQEPRWELDECDGCGLMRVQSVLYGDPVLSVASAYCMPTADGEHDA